MLLLCLHGNSAVCFQDLSYKKLKIKLFWSLETRIRLIFPKSKSSIIATLLLILTRS